MEYIMGIKDVFKRSQQSEISTGIKTQANPRSMRFGSLLFNPDVHVYGAEQHRAEQLAKATPETLVQEAVTWLGMDSNDIGNSRYSVHASALLALADFYATHGNPFTANDAQAGIAE